MKIRKLLSPMIAGWMSVACDPVLAAGFGPVVGGSLGGDWIDESDLDTSDLGLGVRFGDTAARKHYRLALVHTNGRLNHDALSGERNDRFSGLALTGAVAWPIARWPSATLWIAPGLHLSSVEFRESGVRGTGYGLAVALGNDFLVGPHTTFVIEAGLRHVCLLVDEDDPATIEVGEDHDLVELTARLSLLWGK